MTEPKPEKPIDLGAFQRPVPASPITATEIVAALLSLLWLGAVSVWFILAETPTATPGDLSLVMTLFVVFVPIALIWVAAVTARTIRALRDEAERLKVAVDAIRQSYVVQQQQAAATAALKPSVEKKLDEIAQAARQTETAIVTFASRRDAQAEAPPPRRAPPPRPADDQPALALGTPAEDLALPVDTEDLIRALNFPDSPDDAEGFRALRRALADREAARLIRAAQDVLTLLSQDGIFMDDLRPDRARPEVWRRFAQGERGRAIAALGGIRDRSSLALTSARMRSDPVFRDAAHHFLRQFDRGFSAFEKDASDADIAQLADTRTARAFMLFGRVSGVFD
jgi:hypothetical protein